MIGIISTLILERLNDVFFMVYIYCHNGYNGRGDLRGAIVCAEEMIKRHWVNEGKIGECFAFLHDTEKGHRYVVWLDDNIDIRIKRLK